MRQDFLEKLQKSIERITIWILVMSRNAVDIRFEITLNMKNVAARIIFECSLFKNDFQSDLVLFSKNIVNKKLSKKDEALRKNIAKQITNKNDEMFLWIKLQIKNFRKSETRKQLQRTVEVMSIELEHVYYRNWETILNLKRYKSCAFAILRWITFALKSFTIIELIETLIITNHDSVCDYLQFDEWPNNIDQNYIDEQILGLCESMLEIKNIDQKQSWGFKIVHLIHFLIKEFCFAWCLKLKISL